MAEPSRRPEPSPDPDEFRDAALLFEMVSQPPLLRLILSLSEGEKDSRALAWEFERDGRRLSASLSTLMDRGDLATRRVDGARTVYSLTGLGVKIVEAYRLVAEGREGDGSWSARGPRDDDTPRPAFPSVARLINHAAHPLRLRLLLALAEGGRDARRAAEEIGGVTAEVVGGNLRLLLSGSLVASHHHGSRSTYVLSESGRCVVELVLATYRRLAARRGGFALWPEPIDSAGPISYAGLAHLLKSFSDRSRLRLLHLLGSSGGACDCHLLKVIDAPRSNLKNSLASLKSSGFVLEESEGEWARYRLARPALALYEGLSASFGGSISEAEVFGSDARRLVELAPCPAPKPARRGPRSAWASS